MKNWEEINKKYEEMLKKVEDSDLDKYEKFATTLTILDAWGWDLSTGTLIVDIEA